MSAPSSPNASRVVATAGHVDHGKSTLVRGLTGTDPDRWAEEKSRGLTIDLGFAWTTLPSGIELSFVDVPGHVRFLPNMLAGVGGIAACLFVVAATEGWMPQSEEHLRILDLLGTTAGVVALTKVGGLDADEVELARIEISDALAGTFLTYAPMIAVDAPTGLGLDGLRSALDGMLASTAEAADLDRPRLWVDRSFAAAGAGTVVTGTLTGGRVSVGDRVEIVPPPSGGQAIARVRGIQAHGTEVQFAGPGRRLALNLVGPSRHDVNRGQAVVRPGQWEPTTSMDVELRVVPGLDHPVTRRGSFLLHVGSRSCRAELQLLGGTTKLSPGDVGLGRLRLLEGEGLALLPGDRFVLRETGREETVAGGQVLDVSPVLRPGRAAPDLSVHRVVEERGWIEADLLERLTGERHDPQVGRWIVSAEARAESEAAIRALVADAGPLGVDISALDDRQRSLAAAMDDLELSGDRVRAAGSTRLDPMAESWLDELSAAPFCPPAPGAELPPAVVRDLVRRGLVLEADGVYFHPSAVELAAQRIASLLDDQPAGVTVSAVREALGTSRKWAMPLLAHLDATGVTRRRGDVRVGGPRLGKAARSGDGG